MNKKRKLLTLAALAVFSAIIFFHYCDPGFHGGTLRFCSGPDFYARGRPVYRGVTPLIQDVRMPLLLLAVFYAGLFSIMGERNQSKRDATPPRDWRRIKRVILIISVIVAGLVVIAGLIVAIILGHEYDREQEASRKAKIEYEASKHRIAPSEIGLDVQLRANSIGSCWVSGKIRNNSHSYTLTAVDLSAAIYDKAPADKPTAEDIVGEAKVTIRVTVPPQQSRGVEESVFFPNLPKLEPGHWTWRYVITEVRGEEVTR